MTPDDIDSAVVAEVATQLETEGWDIVLDPDAIPGLEVQPALVALRPGELLLVEIQRASAPARQRGSVIADYAQSHGYDFRLFVVPAPRNSPWLAVEPDRTEVDRSSRLRDQLAQANESRARGLFEGGLYLAYVATRSALQIIEAQLGLTPSGRANRAESFDDGAFLVQRGVLDQADVALMRLARELLDRVGPTTEDQPGSRQFDERASLLLGQLIELGGVVIVILDRLRREQLAAYASDYAIARAGPPSDDRTRRMTALLAQARAAARANPPPLAELENMLRSESDGERVIALALLQDRPDSRVFDPIVSAITDSHSAFEQYQALAAMLQVAARLDEYQRSRLAAALNDAVADETRSITADASRLRLVNAIRDALGAA